MGLDMYLRGNKFLWTDWEKPENNRVEDGFKIAEIDLDLGYWRKHPNLHGYIVREFADGIDECQKIDLRAEDLRKTLEAVKADALPHTTGFFFGESRSEDKPETIKILTRAIAWLETEDPRAAKSVYYRASW